LLIISIFCSSPAEGFTERGADLSVAEFTAQAQQPK
jgi:hypothetical protein